MTEYTQVFYTFEDSDGNNVEIRTDTFEEAGKRAAAFMAAQAVDGLSGSITFMPFRKQD